MPKAYVVLRKLPRQKSFTVYMVAPMSKAQALKEKKFLRELGAKGKLKIKPIEQLSLKEIRNLGVKDIQNLWKRRSKPISSAFIERARKSGRKRR